MGSGVNLPTLDPCDGWRQWRSGSPCSPARAWRTAAKAHRRRPRPPPTFGTSCSTRIWPSTTSWPCSTFCSATTWRSTPSRSRGPAKRTAIPACRTHLRLLALGGNHDTPVACGRRDAAPGEQHVPRRVAGGRGRPVDAGPAPGGSRGRSTRRHRAPARHARRRRHADHARSVHEHRRSAPSGPGAGVARAGGRLDGRGDRRRRQHAERRGRVQRVGRPAGGQGGDRGDAGDPRAAGRHGRRAVHDVLRGRPRGSRA